jgi:hypothetical protein
MHSAWRKRERGGWSSPAHGRRRIMPCARLQLEMLEDRLAPSAGAGGVARQPIVQLPTQTTISAILSSHSSAPSLSATKETLSAVRSAAGVNSLPAFPGSNVASAPLTLLSSGPYFEVAHDRGLVFVPAATGTPHTAVGVGGCCEAISAGTDAAGVIRTSFWGSPADKPVETNIGPVGPGKLNRGVPDRARPQPAMPPTSAPSPGSGALQGMDTPSQKRETPPARSTADRLESAARCSAARKTMLASLLPPGTPAFLLIVIFIMSWRILHGRSFLQIERRRREGQARAWLGNEPGPVMSKFLALGGAAFSLTRAPPRIRDPVHGMTRKQGRHACLPCFVFLLGRFATRPRLSATLRGTVPSLRVNPSCSK